MQRDECLRGASALTTVEGTVSYDVLYPGADALSVC